MSFGRQILSLCAARVIWRHKPTIFEPKGWQLSLLAVESIFFTLPGQARPGRTFFVFLLYINDIVESSRLFKFTLFADDTSLYYSCKNTLNLEHKINAELSQISNWLSANRLSLNVGKSKLLFYTNKNRRILKDIEIKINNEELNEVDQAKYLGVTMDNKLNWNAHLNNTKLRLSKGISMLAKIRHYIQASALRSLYFTFINSHIDYNLLNWGTASPTALESICSKTRKAIRIISFKDKDDSAVPLFKQHCILPVLKTLELKQAFFMWKLSNARLPPSLATNFRIVRNQFSIIHNRLRALSSHITFAGPRLWQKLPTAIKDKAYPNSFRKSMQSHLLENLWISLFVLSASLSSPFFAALFSLPTQMVAPYTLMIYYSPLSISPKIFTCKLVRMALWDSHFLGTFTFIPFLGFKKNVIQYPNSLAKQVGPVLNSP